MSPAIITTNLPATKPPLPPIIMGVTVRDFRMALDNARAGTKIVYYIGDLAYDRDYNTTLTPATRRDIGRIADGAYDASMTGKVHLFQRKLDLYMYGYFAVVRR